MIYATIFIIILGMNMVPVFMPSTWIMLSLFSFYFRMANSKIVVIAILSAIAATLGRIILAKFSHIIIRNKFLSESSIENIDDIKEHIEKKRSAAFGLFLFYAFGPFPSGQLFLSYGLTNLPIWMLATPFFIGRLTSYVFWSLTSSEISRRLAVESFRSEKFFGFYFIASQLLSLFVIYLFIRIDWHYLFTEKKLRLTDKQNGK